MAARLDSVGRYICDKSGWLLTNLQLQKILYLAQMQYMGENDGNRLVEANFEAWDFGPVEPSLYRKVKMFGAGPISDVFYEARSFADGSKQKIVLDDICNQLLHRSASELVNLTHWSHGAWAKNYVQGIKGRYISDDDIFEEYKSRIAALDKRASAA